MSQVLYRKYRSRSLDELVGQEHLVTTLKRAIATGRISHAYLFSGPRGVGKTSAARILAHQLNDMPYTEEDSQLDIIEIDAASNRGIDEIRDLREKVYIAPSIGKYKVYIIDEVHMLTPPAFNALLKTLEEPPSHVIFIMATTDAHKLPETIISRTQHFVFKPALHDTLTNHLRSIAKNEGLDITDEALSLIADHGDGSFRDSISLLDQASSLEGKIDLEAVAGLLGLPPAAAIDSIIEAMADSDTVVLLSTLQQLRFGGYQAAAIAKQISQKLRFDLIAGKPQLDSANILRLLTRLIDIPASKGPHQLLELILLEVVLTNMSETRDDAHTLVDIDKTPKSVVPNHNFHRKKTTPTKSAKLSPKPTSIIKTSAEGAGKDTKGIITQEDWQNIIASLKRQYNTLYSVIRMAQVTFEQSQVILEFSFPFHQKIANNIKNKAILSSVVEEITGKKLEIICLIAKASDNQSRSAFKVSESNGQTSSPIENITNIFGGGELLES